MGSCISYRQTCSTVSDAAKIQETLSIDPLWQGRVGGWLSHPSAHLSKDRVLYSFPRGKRKERVGEFQNTSSCQII